MLARLSLRFRATLPFPRGQVVNWCSHPEGNLRLNPSWNRIKNIAVETHIDALDDHTSWLEDRVQCVQPSVWLPVRWTESWLNKLFAYRHRLMANDLDCVARYPSKRLKLLVTGSSGLIGSELVAFLKAAGHEVLELSRVKESDTSNIWWNPQIGQVELARLEGLDGVFHLAGESIVDRWSETKKQRIRESRVTGTLQLIEALSRLKAPPKAFLCASAIGYYGHRGSSLLDESALVGSDFLAGVCRDWEAAAQQYTAGRVACLRFGVVLSPAGGALAQMLWPFRLGLGSRIGSGEQYMSWIGIDDALYQCYHVLMTPSIQGPVNIVSPQAVTNREFTHTLAKALKRPTILSLPAGAVSLIFGEMGRALLLTSQRAVPSLLESTHSKFAFPKLDQTFNHLLG